MSFCEKVILLTGASSGIGAACAEYFGKEGALLALVGRNAGKFELVAERLRSKGIETEPLIILADVSVDAERIISETIEKFGRLDILINNAGFAVFDSLDAMEMTDYDAMMSTNVRAVVQLTKLAVPHLIESNGNIINVSSGLATIAIPHAVAYAISKTMIEQFTKCLAMELGPKGVRVNCIGPGVIDTEFHTTQGVTEDQYSFMCENYKRIHPIKRMGTKEDCVNGIAYLAGERANFVTGLILPIDGGLGVKGVF